MKRNFITIHLLILILLVFGCKSKDDDIVFDFNTTSPSIDFEEYELRTTSQILLNGNVGSNSINLLSANIFFKISANGEKEVGTFHSTFLSYFRKYCLSKNYLALSSMFNNQWIKFSGIGNNANFSFDGVNLGVYHIAADSVGYPYERYNYGFDNVAINDYSQALLPVIKTSNLNEINFITFNLKSFIDSLGYTDGLLLEDNFYKVSLPLEATTELNRIESFQQNFYVSTKENTYMIRPDGTFKFLSEGSADDFFEYDGKIYADFGNRIGFTADDGETWEEKNNTPTFDGFREFQEVYGHLVFFFEDDLYLVDPFDFSFSSLNNKGLEGSKITAVLPFQQSIYVATLSGLFSKPIEELK